MSRTCPPVQYICRNLNSPAALREASCYEALNVTSLQAHAAKMCLWQVGSTGKYELKRPFNHFKISIIAFNVLLSVISLFSHIEKNPPYLPLIILHFLVPTQTSSFNSWRSSTQGLACLVSALPCCLMNRALRLEKWTVSHPLVWKCSALVRAKSPLVHTAGCKDGCREEEEESHGCWFLLQSSCQHAPRGLFFFMLLRFEEFELFDKWTAQIEISDLLPWWSSTVGL